MAIRVLFVSTGDVCRAPMAVGCLRAFVRRARLEDAFEIASAGTYQGADGQPPSLLAQEAASRRGYPIRDLRARRLVPEDLVHFAYTLAMDRTQLATMRLIAPGHLTEHPQMLLKFAPTVPSRDILDPYGGTTQDYETALNLIERGCAGLIEEIGRAMAGERAGLLLRRQATPAAHGSGEGARVIRLSDRMR